MTQPRFQLHLSTAIVLMFVAGGFMALNFRRYPEVDKRKWYQPSELTCCGWPATLFAAEDKHSVLVGKGHILGFSKFNPNLLPWRDGELRIGGLLFNALTLLALLSLTTSICNWLSRRREAHKS